jgi:serine/threonine-protein kinase
VAVVVSHIFTRMGEHVSRAREMGSYRLGELLGRGGMGEVYRATHRMLARPAAIKLIRHEILSDRSPVQVRIIVERFRREAEVAASLQSPHTVALYDFGVTADRTLYLVMELLDGLDLEALVQRHGPLPPARVIHIMLQVCQSLEEAHRRGLVHRDIKAANIHVGRLGLQYDFVKVLDFGLVKVAGAAVGTGDMLHTAANQVLGTPAYMPPEMVLDHKVDARADLYALGCVAYFALTGQLLFEASSPLQMLAKHIHDAPERPSQRSLAPLPPALDELLLACLAKDPAARPASAAALAASLTAIEIDAWTEEDARMWWHANGATQPMDALSPPP